MTKSGIIIGDERFYSVTSKEIQIYKREYARRNKMSKQPLGFVNVDSITSVIERSIDSIVQEWNEQADEEYDVIERIGELNELLDILVELSWRYGKEKVLFRFTVRESIKDAVPMNCIESPRWKERILIDENEQCSKVYIRF